MILQADFQSNERNQIVELHYLKIILWSFWPIHLFHSNVEKRTGYLCCQNRSPCNRYLMRWSSNDEVTEEMHFHEWKWFHFHFQEKLEMLIRTNLRHYYFYEFEFYLLLTVRKKRYRQTEFCQSKQKTWKLGRGSLKQEAMWKESSFFFNDNWLNWWGPRVAEFSRYQQMIRKDFIHRWLIVKGYKWIHFT